MSERTEDGEAAPHPRDATGLIGHAQAELTLAQAYASGRMPHAWLIGGPPSIGKATLAYRLARFVLANPDPSSSNVQAATSLAISPDHRAARQVAARSHPDLLVLERTVGDTGKLRSVIRVEDVRRTIAFFGSTAGEGGWRVCIVDSADELQNPGAANALLKVLEEPPPRSIFILVSHAPGRLLPTIRSRCRFLRLFPPLSQDLAGILRALSADAGDAAIAAAAEAADGSVARALTLLDGQGLAIREQVAGLLARMPALDHGALHALGERLAGSDVAPLAAFMDAVRDWLSAGVREDADLGRLARLAEAWEKINVAARDVEVYNLDRKPLVFSTFDTLARAAR